MRRCDCLECDPLQGTLPVPTIETDLADAPSTRESINQATLPATATKLRVLAVGFLLSAGFSLIEWIAGAWSHSLTLMTDAGHMLLDCLALGLALGATGFAHFMTQRKSELRTPRAETFAALANGLGLLVLAMWVIWEATDRFQHSHPPVVGEVMVITAIIGLGVNLIAASVLHDHSHHDLNVRGAFLHILADTASSVGVIVSACLIWAFHWDWADPAISILIACFIGLGALPLIRESLKIL